MFAAKHNRLRSPVFVANVLNNKTQTPEESPIIRDLGDS
jgi:hypothetical protein